MTSSKTPRVKTLSCLYPMQVGRVFTADWFQPIKAAVTTLNNYSISEGSGTLRLIGNYGQ
jgi:hypothetical protein